MAEVIWSETAKQDAADIADYIALENPHAAKALIRLVLQKTAQLEAFPERGRRLPELQDFPYRELLVKPCRVIYKYIPELERVFVVTVIRQERDLLRYLRNF